MPSRTALGFCMSRRMRCSARLGAEGLFCETTPYDPSSPYSASKAASDHLVLAWHRTYGLPTLISNCSNNYGPYQFPEKLIPLVILNALEGRPLPVYGTGSNVRDWLHVEDHARALLLILEKGRIGDTYNVGGRNEQTNLAVVEQICALVDRLRPAGRPHGDLITFVTDRPGHDARYAIDATKIETELGWRARESFATGLEKTVRWYLDNSAWWRPLRQGVYSGERLGLMPSLASKRHGRGDRLMRGIILAGGKGTRLYPITLCRLEAAPARLRQAHDLLSAGDPHARGHSRDSRHHDPGGSSEFPPPARRRPEVGAVADLSGAAGAGRPGPGLYHRRGLRCRTPFRAHSRRQHLLRPRLA